MKSNKLMLMMAQLLHHAYDANDFSYDFPNALSESIEELKQENLALAELLNEEMPEACSYYDPYNTGDFGTLTESAFRAKVYDVYTKALPLVIKKAV